LWRYKLGNKSIVIIGTFDTKSDEFIYIKDLITENNCNVITIDVGTGVGGDPKFPPDYPRNEVAKAAGTTIEDVLSIGKSGQEVRATEMLADGAIKICQRLLQSGSLGGIVSLGGTMGTNLGTRVMKSLPFGIPKVMLSTVASGDTSSFIETSDIVMMPSIADIAGLNRITKVSLAQAAGAVMGMVAASEVAIGELKASGRPLIGVTTLGGTTGCALHFKKQLEVEGYEVAIFHSNGVGGRSMEELIEQGSIQGVFDLSIVEVIDHAYGGYSDAGPARLEVAGRKGIPQLVAPGNLDHIIYTSPEKIPERFKGQYMHRHGPSICVLRTQKNEMIEMAGVIAQKLNSARGPTAVIIPLRGFSIMEELEESRNPEANNAFVEALKPKLKPEIEVKEVDAYIRDEYFAKEAAEMFLKLVKGSAV
jgi:uncharacterized protein (UPF0261 family)